MERHGKGDDEPSFLQVYAIPSTVLATSENNVMMKKG